VLRGEPAVCALARGNFIMCPTLCYRRSVLQGRRFSGRWQFVQDLDFTTRLLMDGDTLIGLPCQAYAYRRHAENATSKYTANLYRFAEERAFLDELSALSAERSWSAAARTARHKTIIKLHLIVRALRDLVHFQPAAAIATVRLLATL
jgi:hypothetical protein